MKIAVIGTGISGLTTALLLNRRHDITVFESNNYIGGHTNTIFVKDHGQTLPVDTGFIVFNETNYPNLCQLFDRLGVESRDSDMSFSVHCEKTGLEYNGTSLNGIFSQRRNLLRPGFWFMLRDILRFHDDAKVSLDCCLDDQVTVADYVNNMNYSNGFVENYLVPLGASLWSCPASRFREFPMRFVIEFMANHHMLQVNQRPIWKTVVGGSSSYIGPLTAPYKDSIRISTPVKQISRQLSSVKLTLRDGGGEEFDEVVIATHANHALQLLENPQTEENEMLGHFEYQLNDVVLHTDTRLLPKSRNAWASWNYRIPESATDVGMVTYNMNMLQGLSSKDTYCVSLNQTADIDPERIIYRITYQHPQFSTGRDQVQKDHERLIRNNRISYCGAYWGFGFHEDGISSALRVCSAFDEVL